MTTSPLEAHVPAWNIGEVSGRRSRSPVGWLSQVGMGLLSFFSRLTDDTSGASSSGRYDPYDDREPDPGPVVPGDDKCCHLALPDKECPYSGDRSNYYCREGWYRQWWFCCEGTQQVGCGECTRSTSNCWSGPFDCSIWWWTRQRC